MMRLKQFLPRLNDFGILLAYLSTFNFKTEIMKKISLLLALIFSIGLFAQDDFSGIISYEISYEDMNDQMKQMESMLPKSMTVEIKDGMSKTIQPNAMGGETIVISDNNSGESLTLMNMMGNKIALKTEKEDLEDAQEENDIEIEYLDETMEIAGYECKKALITANDGSEVVVYYTNELPSANVSSNIKQIDGFPMQMEISQEMFTMITKVTEVNETKVKKIKMEVPSDYDLKTKEELQKMMGGGN